MFNYKKIKELRKKNGDTLKCLAKKVNYDFSNLSKIERGIYQPSLPLLNKIAEVYNVELGDFLDLHHSSSNNNYFVNIGDKSFPFPTIESILNNLSSGFFILDHNWSIIYLNHSMENWVRKERDDLIGFNIWEALPDAVGTSFYYFYNKAMNEQISVTFEDYYERTHEWLKVTVEPYKGGIIGYVTNITENRKKEETINHIILHDFLTDLPNRNMLNLRLSNELSIASQKKQRIAVLFINLARFKLINNTLGFQLGDILLKEVSKRLQISLDNQAILYRYIGDEFVVILADSDRNKASKLASRIIEHFNTPINIANNEIFTSLSIGISLSPDNGETAEALIKHASLAMEQSKKAGTSTYEFYLPLHREVKINPLKIETELHKAIEHNQFSLHYQPKIDLITGYLVGVEALLRWNHPQWGMVSPETFIRISEETGLILPIGEWALLSACRQLKKWQEQGISTVVTIHLTQKQFIGSNIVKTIANVLQATRLAPNCLEIKLSDSMACDFEHSISKLQQLKKLGVSICIDNFGTGLSSLYYLKKFPIDTLNIDQPLVHDIHNNPNGETIIKTIISMAHNLNMNVVAGGVETKEQLLFLQQQLCDQGQGYFFCKPLSANELKEKLSEVQQVVKLHGIPKD